MEKTFPWAEQIRMAQANEKEGQMFDVKSKMSNVFYPTTLTFDICHSTSYI